VKDHPWTIAALHNYLKPAFYLVRTAIWKGKRKMKRHMRRKAAFTLIEIMVVVAIIAVLSAIAVPNFTKARINSQRTVCISNLKQIDNAKTTWGMERSKDITDSPDDGQLFGNSRYIRTKPVCPSNGDYTVATLANRPSCSFGPTDGHTL
jgi:prepilin-type N-terminal cleavage/methylation domain-containing protein